MKKGTFTVIGFALLAAISSVPLMADQWVNTEIPVGTVVAANACTNQAVAFQGTAHNTVNITINNNSFHAKMHLNMQNVSGTGLSDGAKYNVVDVSNLEINMSGLPPVETQSVVEFGLIGAGQAANMRIHMAVHITVNANGDVTAEFGKSDIICQ
ncbi:MAG TPA: hypothetical protein VIW67_24360 [Terriglobales bacterium]|jgi:hypothetical protein